MQYLHKALDFFKQQTTGTQVALAAAASAVVALPIIKRISGGKYAKLAGVNVSGKVVIITGSNTGIGKMTALQMYERGAHVILANRSKERTEPAIKYIQKSARFLNEDCKKTAKLTFIPLDLENPKSVVEFVKQFHELNTEGLDFLINNAGAIGPLSENKYLPGLESNFVTNYLGHFLLTELLIQDLAKTKGRVVNVSSVGHTFFRNPESHLDKLAKYSAQQHADHLYHDKVLLYGGSFQQYTFTKYCNVMHTYHLHNLYHEKYQIDFNTLHPGAVSTDIWRHANPILKPIHYFFFSIIGRSEWEGSQTTMHVACCLPKGSSGAYYDNCTLTKHNPACDNKIKQKELYDYSVELVKQYLQ